METKKVVDPRKIEQGKRLAEYNRQRREEIKRLKKRDDDALTISQEDEKEIPSSKNIFIPILTLSIVVGTFGVYFYYHKPKKVELTRPKILTRLEKI